MEALNAFLISMVISFSAYASFPPSGFGTGGAAFVYHHPIQPEEIIELAVKAVRNEDYDLFLSLFDDPSKSGGIENFRKFRSQLLEVDNLVFQSIGVDDQVIYEKKGLGAMPILRDLFRINVTAVRQGKEIFKWGLVINRYSVSYGNMCPETIDWIPVIYKKPELRERFAAGCHASLNYKIGIWD
jgi:hypothetical protein